MARRSRQPARIVTRTRAQAYAQQNHHGQLSESSEVFRSWPTRPSNSADRSYATLPRNHYFNTFLGDRDPCDNVARRNTHRDAERRLRSDRRYGPGRVARLEGLRSR